MHLLSPYVTAYRRRRDRAYVVRMRWAVAGAITFHLALAGALAPFKQQIPLVRRVGYEGPVQLLPEISVLRDPGEFETEQQAQGKGREGFFRVIETRLVQSERAIEQTPRQTTNDYEEEYGEELLSMLEMSLPQPTSRDVVLLRFVKPVYPPQSIAEGTEGVVEFRVHVTERGRVARAWILSSDVDGRMELAARRALQQWRFRPHLIEGTAVDFLVDQRIRFRLHDAMVTDPSTAGLR